MDNIAPTIGEIIAPEIINTPEGGTVTITLKWTSRFRRSGAKRYRMERILI